MIQGKLANLRAIEAVDSNVYHLWINDDETNQWRGLYHPQSQDEAKKWIKVQRSQRPDALSLTIEAKDGIPIGFVGFQNICLRSRRAEIWIYLGSKPHWNQGIGEDVVRSLCIYAFDQMNLFRVWLECNPEFANVVRCYQKVGFIQEGTLRKAYFRNGDFHDTCIMGLLRSDLKRDS